MILTYLSLLISTALAAPTSLSYEGVLTDTSGNPVTTAVSITARIAGDAGGSCIVNGTGYSTTVTPDASGFFAIQISGLTSEMFLFPGTCVGSTDRYLLITVDGEDFPPIQMDSSPYAMSAAVAGRLVGTQGATTAGQVLTWDGSAWIAQNSSAGAETDPTVSAWAKNPALLATDVPALDTSKITTGTLSVARGGTGASAFTAGHVIVSNGTSLQTLGCANGEVIKFNVSGVAACATDQTATDASSIVSGILPMSRGGTGSASIAANRLVMSNGSELTEVPQCTAGQVLAYDNSGPYCLTPSTSPTGAAGGDLTGTYPNPTIANNVITSAKIVDGTITAADLQFDVIQDLGGTPSIQSGLLASRPTSGIAGRLYLATDTNQLFRDTGAVWNPISTPGVKVGTAAPWNVVVGSNAFTAGSGSNNSVFGTGALQNSTSGSNNTAIGYNANRNSTNGNANTAVGAQSLLEVTTGTNNTAIGFRSGEYATGGSSRNIFIGNQAGPSTLTNVQDKLYIDVSADDTPLIFGDFANRYVAIDGPIKIGSTAVTCSALYIGAIRFTGTEMQFCDGTSWMSLASGGGGGGGVNSVIVNSPLVNLGTSDDLIVGLASGFVTGQSLRWDGSNWTPSLFNLSDMDNVSSTLPFTGQVLKWTGVQWEPATDLGLTGFVNPNRVPRSNGADLVDGSIFDNGVQVGIGTTTPMTDFHVNGEIMTNNIRVGGPGTQVNLVSAAISDFNLMLPTSLPVTSGLMSLSSSGFMSWHACGVDQVLKFNGSTWSCSTISRAADQLIATEAYCGGDEFCDLPAGFEFSPFEMRISIMKFAMPGASSNMVQIGINGSNYNYVYEDGSGSPVLANTLNNGDTFFVKYIPTASPAGWYLERQGGGGGGGSDGYERARTVASVEFTKTLPTTIMDTTGTEIEPGVWSASGGTGSGYRGPNNPGDVYPGTYGVIVLEADTSEFATLSMCDPSNMYNSRIHPSTGSVYSFETQLYAAGGGSAEVAVGFGVPNAFDPWLQSFSAMARFQQDTFGNVSGSYAQICYGIGFCEPSSYYSHSFSGGYHVRVEYLGTQAMKVYVNGDEVHYRNTFSSLSGSDRPCPMIQLKGMGGTARLVIDNMILKKWHDSSVP